MQYHATSNKTINTKKIQNCRRTSQQVGGCLKDFLRNQDLTSTSQVKEVHELNVQKDAVDYTHINEKQKLKECYLHMQKVLMEENNNLKKQIQYLTQEVRKTYKRQKLEKEKVNNLKNQKKQMSLKMQKLTHDNQQIKQFVKTELLFLMTSLQSTSLQEIIFEIKKIIKQFKTYLKIDINIMQNSKHGEALVKSSYKTLVNSNAHNTQQEINCLNDQFEALMYQYKTNNKSEIRKKCLDIAKQIQNLKKMNNLQETTQDLSYKKQPLTQRISIYDARDSINLLTYDRPQTDRAYIQEDQEDKFCFKYSTNQKPFHTHEILPWTQNVKISNRRRQKSKSVFGQQSQITKQKSRNFE